MNFTIHRASFKQDSNVTIVNEKLLGAKIHKVWAHHWQLGPISARSIEQYTNTSIAHEEIECGMGCIQGVKSWPPRLFGLKYLIAPRLLFQKRCLCKFVHRAYLECIQLERRKCMSVSSAARHRRMPHGSYLWQAECADESACGSAWALNFAPPFLVLIARERSLLVVFFIRHFVRNAVWLVGRFPAPAVHAAAEATATLQYIQYFSNILYANECSCTSYAMCLQFTVHAYFSMRSGMHLPEKCHKCKNETPADSHSAAIRYNLATERPAKAKLMRLMAAWLLDQYDMYMHVLCIYYIWRDARKHAEHVAASIQNIIGWLQARKNSEHVFGRREWIAEWIRCEAALTPHNHCFIGRHVCTCVRSHHVQFDPYRMAIIPVSLFM